MSGSKSSGRKPFRRTFPRNGVRKTSIPLAVARDPVRDSVLGDGSGASAPHAHPFRKYRQPAVDLANLLVGQTVVSRIILRRSSCPDGFGPGLSEGDCPRV